MTTYSIGDRVRLAAPMQGEEPYNPMPVGSTGTVNYVNGPVNLGDGPFMQISVDWDNGRRLMAITPPDQLQLLDNQTKENA